MEKLTRARFTNLNKIMYPEAGISKREVIKYYIQVAPKILPFLKDRSLSIARYPDGVQAEGFYGKDAPQGTPDWVKLHHTYSETAGREMDYVVCDNIDTLLWLANLAAIELHIPLARISDLDHPDLLFFDLDPQPPAGFREAAAVARLVRKKLASKNMKAWVKTSGKRGLHLIASLSSGESFDETRSYVHKIGIELAEETGMVSSEKSKKKPGTIYLDYPQNSSGRTMACPYSLRATPGATVSTPISWDQLEEIDPTSFTIRTVPEREDIWKDFWD